MHPLIRSFSPREKASNFLWSPEALRTHRDYSRDAFIVDKYPKNNYCWSESSPSSTKRQGLNDAVNRCELFQEETDVYRRVANLQKRRLKAKLVIAIKKAWKSHRG